MLNMISVDTDRAQMDEWLARDLVTESVAQFVEGPGIYTMDVRFDIGELQTALEEVSGRATFEGDVDAGFGVIPLTRRPGAVETTEADLSGR
jgi:hypothetical protein